jgi:hypothetical protein
MRLLTSFVSVWLAGGLAQANYVEPRDLVTYDTVKAACSELQGEYPNLTLFPNTTDYDDEVINTWDKRANLIPGCIFRPTKGTQVTKALSIFHRNKAEFAVRGGGHLPVSYQINSLFINR